METIYLNDLPEPSQTKIPLCTLKKFPSQINHCIHWTKEIFKELFEEGINELQNFINDKEKYISIFTNSLNDSELYLKVNKIKYFIRIFENKMIVILLNLPCFYLYIILIYLLIYF